MPVKHLLLAAAAVMAAPCFAGDVSVSVGINQPGFFGQITIGDYPRPAVIYAEPVIIERVPAYVIAEPIYVRVPPGHEKHWARYCGAYHACSRPVYFVREEWYQKEYVPRMRQRYVEEHEEKSHHD